MEKVIVSMVYIMALAARAEGSFEIKISSWLDRTSSKIGCHFGDDDACLRSFYLEHRTEILVGFGIAILVLIGCCVSCCRCGRRKREVVYMPAPTSSARAPTSNAYKI